MAAVNINFRLGAPKVVAIAQDDYLTPRHPFSDPAELPSGVVPEFGQDLESGVKRMLPGSGLVTVGDSEASLTQKMNKLLVIFASGDATGMAQRLFTSFLSKQSQPAIWSDSALDRAAQSHPNIQSFLDAALLAPTPGRPPATRIRIHQALKLVGWDIRRLNPVQGLGVPAFNRGSKLFATEDFDNGLGVMINGIQYAYVIATSYTYTAAKQTYDISLKYVFYDVFGLDDDDLKEFGAYSHTPISLDASIGITAWWQLQHQHGYAPLVTRAIVRKTFKNVPAH